MINLDANHCAKNLMCAALALASSMSICAQTDAQADNSAQVWRATSRLGYGPTPATARTAEPNPKAWAVSQIEAAHAASLHAPAIATDAARFNQSLQATIKDFQAEREARKNVKLLLSANWSCRIIEAITRATP